MFPADGLQVLEHGRQVFRAGYTEKGVSGSGKQRLRVLLVLQLEYANSLPHDSSASVVQVQPNRMTQPRRASMRIELLCRATDLLTITTKPAAHPVRRRF